MGAFSTCVTVGCGFCSDATSSFTAEYSSSESTRIASSPHENTRYSVTLPKKAHVSHLHHGWLLPIDGVVLHRLLGHSDKQGVEVEVGFGALVDCLNRTDGVLEVLDANAVQPVHAAAQSSEIHHGDAQTHVPGIRQTEKRVRGRDSSDEHGNDGAEATTIVSPQQRLVVQRHQILHLALFLLRQHAFNGENGEESQSRLSQLDMKEPT